MKETTITARRIIFLIVIVSFAGFAAVAMAMSMAVTAPVDQYILTAFRNPDDFSDALGPAWLEKSATEFTALGGYPILITIALIVFFGLWIVQRYSAALFMAISVVTGALASSLLKFVFARPRPDLVDHLDRVFTWSFPSGHSMVGMLTWLTLAAVIVRFVSDHNFRVFVLSVAISLGLLIGVSRVYLGVHWPSDVLAGWFLGIAWAGSSWLVAGWIARHEPQADLGYPRA